MSLLENDPLVVELIHPHVTPGPCTSECKASNCPKAAAVGPSWPARLGILPVPDMCVHLDDTLCTRQRLHSVQPGHSEANEEARAILDPRRGQGPSKLQEEPAGELKGNVYPCSVVPMKHEETEEDEEVVGLAGRIGKHLLPKGGEDELPYCTSKSPRDF